MGNCRHCGGRLVYQEQTCRNILPTIACDQCGTQYDRSYSPSSVFVEVQTQRRSCLASPIKFHLRDCQVSPPKLVGERCWIVYNLPNGLTVYYHSGLQHYDVGGAGEPPRPIGNAQGLIDWLASTGGLCDGNESNIQYTEEIQSNDGQNKARSDEERDHDSG